MPKESATFAAALATACWLALKPSHVAQPVGAKASGKRHKASKLPNAIKKVLNGFEVVEAVREPTHCETLGLLWQQLAKRKKAHRAALKQQPKVKPLELFA